MNFVRQLAIWDPRASGGLHNPSVNSSTLKLPWSPAETKWKAFDYTHYVRMLSCKIDLVPWPGWLTAAGLSTRLWTDHNWVVIYPSTRDASTAWFMLLARWRPWFELQVRIIVCLLKLTPKSVDKNLKFHQVRGCITILPSLHIMHSWPCLSYPSHLYHGSRSDVATCLTLSSRRFSNV